MRAATLIHPAAEQLFERLEPFLSIGALTELDVHVVDTLGAHVGETAIDVLLALALAVRAPGRGHICLSLAAVCAADILPEDADPAAAELLVLPTDRAAWMSAVANSPLVGEGRPFVLEGEWLYTQRYFGYEELLCRSLRARLTQQRPVKDPALLTRGLAALFSDGPGSERQRLGAAMAALRGFTVISGGPGTGKTYTVSRVLTLLWAQWATSSPEGIGPRVALAAPTGKAAARMKESIDNGLSGLLGQVGQALPDGRHPSELSTFLTALVPATLHRLLGFQPFNPTRFRHNADNPLPADIVIVDEASMVDFAMMAKLVDATARGARLILLGDKYQLASVEAGTVLADIAGPVRADAPTLSQPFLDELKAVGVTPVGVSVAAAPGPQDGVTLLNHSVRFTAESGIGRFASACLADPIDPQAALSILSSAPAGADVGLYPHTADGQLSAAAIALIVQGYRDYLELLRDGPTADQSLEQHHAAALLAFDRFRVLAAHRRGRLGVEGLNQRIASALAEQIGVVAPNKRTYLGRPVLVRRNDPVVGRYNGDVGLFVTDSSGQLVVAFSGPSGVEYLAAARLPEHQTVFAMTIHKSQGSEFHHAMVVLPSAPSPILTRELIYTGATRAKRRMSLVGGPEVLLPALQRTVHRASGLRRKLWQETSASQ